MKRFLAFCLAAVTALSTSAQAPQPPEVAARSYILVDLNSQQVLAEVQEKASSQIEEYTSINVMAVNVKARRVVHAPQAQYASKQESR